MNQAYLINFKYLNIIIYPSDSYLNYSKAISMIANGHNDKKNPHISSQKLQKK